MLARMQKRGRYSLLVKVWTGAATVETRVEASHKRNRITILLHTARETLHPAKETLAHPLEMNWK